MKKLIYYFLLGVFMLGGLSSCSLDADPNSATDQQAVFSTYGLAEKAVMAIHQSFGETNSYRGRFIPYYGINSDVEWINDVSTAKIGQAKYQLCTYAATATNSEMNTDNNAWAKMYEGIERANMAIQGLRAYGNVASDASMAYLLGEALTLRAVIYLDLVKGWGDVPARFSPVTSATIYLPKSDRDTIYKHILADLKEAEDYVAWPNQISQTTSTERVSKSFVKGLRARAALYAGGYSQRADGIRLSNDPELERTAMYTIARDECLDIINAGYNSLGNFKDNFTRLCKDVVTAGAESLWEIPFSKTRGRNVYTWGVKHQAADQYYNYSSGGGGVNGPLPYLFYDYDVDDVRRDVTCVPYQWSAESTSKQELSQLKKMYFGKLRYEWMDRVVSNSTDDGINWQVMRLADVYLMAAEAINELSGPADAQQYFKPVLDRALPAAKVTSYLASVSTDNTTFFNAIVDQRALEFAGEGLRKADLIRWNLLKSKMDEAKNKMTQLANHEGAYADLPTYLYTKLDKDGETLLIYGLNHGDTDSEGLALVASSGYSQSTSKWIGTSQLPTEMINLLYVNNPDENQFWPIWQYFIDSSNGTLSN